MSTSRSSFRLGYKRGEGYPWSLSLYCFAFIKRERKRGRKKTQKQGVLTVVIAKEGKKERKIPNTKEVAKT